MANDFLPFNTENNNTLTQEEYENDTQRINGLQSGIARSKLFNKALKQACNMASAFGQVVSDAGLNATEDLAVLVAAIKQAISAPFIGISQSAANLYGLTGSDANVDKAIKRGIGGLSAYHVFCFSEDANEIDVALGIRNTDKVSNLGLQLAMYAWFKGSNKDSCPFTELIKCDTSYDIVHSSGALSEIENNAYINVLINNSYLKYSIELVTNGITTIDVSKEVDLTPFGENLDACLIGGGGSGGTSSATFSGGGAGGYMKNFYNLSEFKFMAIIGAGGTAGGGGATSLSLGSQYIANGGGAGVSTNNPSGNTRGGGNGGCGGGGLNLGGSSTDYAGAGGYNGSNGGNAVRGTTNVSLGGSGDEESKHPFEDVSLPLYCGGGGGAAYYANHNGAGGAGGGGAGGGGSGSDATLYGGGGGGNVSNFSVGKGYQGAVIIRKHVVA